MSLRIHRYDDGREGLAAFCDTCREQITPDTNAGYVIWNPDDVSDWRVVHTGRCDPGWRRVVGGGGYREVDSSRYSCSESLDVSIVYLANSAGVDLVAARRTVRDLAEFGL